MLQHYLAMVPIVWIVIALTLFKWPGHKACLSALALTAVLALVLWRMPVLDIATSALEGFATALWPIILVIVAAIFTYNLSLRTGAMSIIQRLLSGVSSDKRVLILLVGWCFGGFLEGMAGFGTAIAIPAGMLAGMGMNPVAACVVCMIANAFPTAFGSVAIPTVTLSALTGLDILPLGFVTALQMIPFMLLVPFMMVLAGSGKNSLKGVVGITLVSGLSFTLPGLVVAKFLGPELVVVVGSVCALLCTLGMARLRRNKPVPAEFDLSAGIEKNASGGEAPSMKLVTACLPYILIFVFLLLSSKLVPPINNVLAAAKTSVQISTAAAAGKTAFSWFNTPGVIIFVAAVIGSLAQGASLKLIGRTLLDTVKQLSKTILTVMSVLGVAKIMTYSGMIDDMASLFVILTGSYYAFVAPIIAVIGAFVTGSGTNTEVLLGTLQTTAAQQIGVSQYWLAAANSLGAGIGKVMSPQCIATAAAAVGLTGQDSKLLRAVIKWTLILLVLSCLLIGFGVSYSPV